MKHISALLIIICTLVMVPSAQAAIVFLDNFEDGNPDGWLESTPAGTGSTGVEIHNDSQMAYAKHTGSYLHSLSHDFIYRPDDILSFDMHAETIYGGNNANAWAGVTVSFLNSFNATIGSARLLNTTNSSSLGTHDMEIDSSQHSYRNTWTDFANLAGLSTSDPIAKVSLQFWAQGQTTSSYTRTYRSTANVWFDNVQVESVPVPPAIVLFGSGLVGLLGVMRRKRQ